MPEEQFRDVPREPPETDSAGGAVEAFCRACRGGKTPWTDFDYASALTEFLLLGNIATQFDGLLDFDPTAMKNINSADGDALLRCEYRPGWTLQPGPRAIEP